MRVIGIDPGYDRLGVAVIEPGENGKEKLLYSTCIETNRDDSIPVRLHSLGEQLAGVIVEYKPDALGIETLFFNTNQKTAINVAGARGIVLYVAQVAGCTIHEYSPQQIKTAMTGYGKSDKSAVIDMVRRLVVNAPADGLDDEYDAIAVAVTCLASCHR